MTHNYLFLFHEQYAVKKLYHQLQQDNFSVMIIDVPRKLSSECELAISTYLSENEDYKKFINNNIRAIYKVNSNHFDLLWQDKN
ncbi:MULTISPECIES: putative Se/S carrier-like protein [Gammaproteobacteria]|uniref:putative Se/S carrier-like protein n=1 Tax=Gammaproteobacteria TaxID=1236 RepID=UPI0018660F53|nr:MULTISPECIES: putative Se/S carrier-like protein [Gammaproteobacteria]